MHITLRKIQNTDKDTFFALAKETWVNKKALQDPSQIDLSWKNMFCDTETHYAIVKEEEICGFCSILHFDRELQEIGIELFKIFQHQGIGYAALTQLLEICKSKYHLQKVHSKVYPDNYPSILLMRKVGGLPLKTVRNACIDPSSVAKFEAANADLISDNLCNIADLFLVSPDHLISNLLIFEISLPVVQPQFSLSLTGDLHYKKRIETQAIRCMLSQVTKSIEELLDKHKTAMDDKLKEEIASLLSKYNSLNTSNE